MDDIELFIMISPPLVTLLPMNYTERNVYNTDGAPNGLGIHYEGIKHGEEIPYNNQPSYIVHVETQELTILTIDQFDYTIDIGYIEGTLLIRGEPYIGIVELYRKMDNIWIKSSKSNEDGYFIFEEVEMNREYYAIAFNENRYTYPPVIQDRLFPKAKIYANNWCKS